MSAIQCEDLRAGYGGVVVLREVSLEVRPGEVVALLGPNGAGKTTLLLVLAGSIKASGGNVTVLGQAVAGGRPHVMARRGSILLPDGRAVFANLSVAENLRLGPGGSRGSDQALEYFPVLKPLLSRRAGLLSGGEQQMLAVGRAMASRPKVLMIDEMSLGLAPIIVRRLLPAVRRMADEFGTAVLLVEQHVDLVLGIADRAYVLDRGTIVLSGEAAQLRSRRDLITASYMGESAYDRIHAPSGPADADGWSA